MAFFRSMLLVVIWAVQLAMGKPPMKKNPSTRGASLGAGQYSSQGQGDVVTITSVAANTQSSPNACPSDWRKGSAQLRNARRRWQIRANRSNYCYKFILYRPCRCTPDFRGPFSISVKNGVVVSPANSTLPSMDGIYDYLQSTCYARCPTQGAAACIVNYTSIGVIQEAFIDQIKYAVDDEITYQISNFSFC